MSEAKDPIPRENRFYHAVSQYGTELAPVVSFEMDCRRYFFVFNKTLKRSIHNHRYIEQEMSCGYSLATKSTEELNRVA